MDMRSWTKGKGKEKKTRIKEEMKGKEEDESGGRPVYSYIH